MPCGKTSELHLLLKRESQVTEHHKTSVQKISFHFTGSDSVLQRALIEDVGGEGAEGRVHAVLDLQTDWPDPQNYQTLKQRLGQTSFSCLLTHHHRTQLAVITHQNQLRKKKIIIIKMK